MGSFAIWLRGIRGKLLFLVSLPAIVIMVLSAVSYTQISNLTKSLESANLVRLPLAQFSGDMDSSINGTIRWLWVAHGAEGNMAERTRAIENARKNLDSFRVSYEEFNKLPRPEKLKEMFRPVDENYRSFQEAVGETLSVLSKGTPKDDETGKTLITTKVRQSVAPMGKALSDMDEARLKMAKVEAENEISSAHAEQTILSITGILCTISLFILGIFMASRLALTLGNVTQSISDSGTQVSSASQQLSTASQSLSSGATEAASSLEETVSSLEELSSMVKLNADNAKEASSLSLASRKSAEDGENEIRNLIGAMTDISKSSKKIEEIINVIDDIAFQTNLLALNAAVEAARAGEQGKGFAVVAEAVRNLAQRSASAAKDITVLIKDSVQQISNGSRIADQSGEVLKNIVTSVKKVSDLNNEIASASAEQSNGISQISKAMNELDQATQRNAASAEETAASSEEMSAQAVELQGLVSQLSSVIDGSNSLKVTPKSTPKTEKPRYNVVPIKKAAPAKPSASYAPTPASPSKASSKSNAATDMIPFDDDAPTTGKVGTTDGF